MTKTEKLEVLQEVANAVVNRDAELKSLEIILVAIGARHEPVFVEALDPEKANHDGKEGNSE